MLFGKSHDGLVSLGDLVAPLSTVELNVAVRGDVRSDAAMSTVGSPATSDGALDCYVSDHALLGVKTLNLGVALEVEQQLSDSLG